jgi:uroporphyrin-III C-methyltransferase
MNTERIVGTVYLVGAGPGDPELMTVRGSRLLQVADAIVHDALVNPELLDEATPLAQRFDVGKRAGQRCVAQQEISDLLVRLARTHSVVVRLKGGDPFVFGRGGEEALALQAAGVPFEVVPGVTSGVAALAYAGIPLTHRGLASSATFMTGHHVSGPGTAESANRLPDPANGTLVVFMGLTHIEEITGELIRGGRAADTPAAVVESGTYPHQRTVTGSLANIATKTREAGIEGPALVVVGDVVRLRDQLAWVPEHGHPSPQAVEAAFAALMGS